MLVEAAHAKVLPCAKELDVRHLTHDIPISTEFVTADC